MTPFVIQLTRGFKPEELDDRDKPTFKKLQELDTLEEVEGLVRLRSIYRAGELYINKEGKGFLGSLFKEQKDLLIEPNDLNGAKERDFVVVKRVIARRGRPSAKVVAIVKYANIIDIYISQKSEDAQVKFINIRNSLDAIISSDKIDIKIYKEGTLFKVDALTNKVLDIIGHIDDPKVDEIVALTLHNRYDQFPLECVEQAKSVPSVVKESELADRVDLRELDFCTIDPVSAKDFDDAIYWDNEKSTLYVAIADVSSYVPYYSDIDKEAIKRGFTTYFPHKSFPMLPRELSENICSLKPYEDRLSFIAKMKLNMDTLETISSEFFEGVIHSKRRFNYDEIDSFIKGEYKAKNENEERIFAKLKPLYEVTKRLKKKRLQRGFDFRSHDIRVELDANYLIKRTTIETGTPSHSLIEECMLLANKASAQRFTGECDSIFRIHEPPKDEKIADLIAELATIGIFVESQEDEVNTIKLIQKEAQKLGLRDDVDELIIKSMKQASYSCQNVGHFGLGFDYYSHFTSPIRRYSDLILHRLIKAQLRDDKTEIEYLLRNIEPLSARVSELERESTKCEWDFRDRKFARWAKENIDKTFRAKITVIDVEDTNKGARAKLLDGLNGVTVELRAYNAELFDEIEIEISEVNLYLPSIVALQVSKKED